MNFKEAATVIVVLHRHPILEKPISFSLFDESATVLQDTQLNDLHEFEFIFGHQYEINMRQGLQNSQNFHPKDVFMQTSFGRHSVERCDSPGLASIFRWEN